MRTIILLLSTVTVIAAAGLCAIQWRGARRPDPESAALREQIQIKERELEELRAANQHLEEQRDELLSRRATTLPGLAATVAIAAPVSSGTNQPQPPKEPGGLGQIVSSMMNDPEMRKFIRDQQAQMMDSLYGPLVKQMGLTADEAARFKELLLDNQMKGAEKAAGFFGNTPGTNLTEMMSTLKAEQTAADAQLKAFLGEARFSQFQEYQQTAGERMQLNLYRAQTASSQDALSDPQFEQLLAFMKEEKQGLAGVIGGSLPGAGRDEASLQAMLSPDQADKLMQGQELLNQRVYQRASTVLSPKQLDALARWQASQLQMMRLGMNMARKLLGPDQPGSASAPPAP